MHRLRLFWTRHAGLTAWLVAATLAMKLLVPSGFMPVASAHAVTIQPCSGFGPEQIMAAMPGMDHPDHGKAGPRGKDMPCGFAGLSLPTLGGAGTALLALAIAYIMAVAFRPEGRCRIPSLPHLRPPLRGPPHP